MLLNLVKLGISWIVLVVLMVLQQVPITAKIIYVLPIYCILLIWTFGFCSILLHFGVFIDDLTHAVSILMQMLFFLTGIFYDISTRLEAPLGHILLVANPVAACITSMRNSLIYGNDPDFFILAIWLLIAVIVSMIGVRTIYKYENTYVKVV